MSTTRKASLHATLGVLFVLLSANALAYDGPWVITQCGQPFDIANNADKISPLIQQCLEPVARINVETPDTAEGPFLREF